ncbi:centromere protein P isoform X2 [Notamacropus eugenii]|uniref:centromere protein P isoform X2 n=1 Tax=Notamacropus eugenii TaxID=9315 RepID=UPI003B66E588
MALEQQRLELRALRAEIAPLEAQLGRSESGLSFLSRLTGVRITEYCVTRSSERARNGGLRVLRKGHLAGDCCAGINISFQLEFQLLETQSEETFTVAITDLSIILEPVENKELSRFVARTEEKRDLFLFFRSLYFFQEWCEYRKRTFHYFKEKHPKVVQLPEGPAADAMVLQSPSVPGPEPGQEERSDTGPPLLPDPPAAAGHRGCPGKPHRAGERRMKSTALASRAVWEGSLIRTLLLWSCRLHGMETFAIFSFRNQTLLHALYKYGT